MSSHDSQMLSAMETIREMSDRIHLPKSIQDRASTNYKHVLDSKQLRGKNPDAKAAACLYIACRMENVPRTFKGECLGR